MTTELFNSRNRNILLLFAESIFSLGTGIVPFTTTLSDFINKYYKQGNSGALYGIFTASVIAVATLPKLLTSRRLEHATNCRSLFVWNIHLMRACWFVLGLIMCSNVHPSYAYVGFYVVYIAYSFLQGMNDVIYTHIYQCVIPLTLRGPFFGWKQTIDNIAQVIGSCTAFYLLSLHEFPINYGLTFFVIFILGMVSNVVLGTVAIPDNATRKPMPSLLSYTSEVTVIIKKDKALWVYVISSILATTGGVLKQFFVLFAVKKLGANVFTTSHVALAASINGAAKIVSGLAWGHFRHHYGLKATLFATRVVSAVPFVCMLLSPLSHYWIYVAFFCYGSSTCGYLVTKSDVYIVLGKEQSATYMSVSTLLALPFRFVTPILVGFMVDSVGYELSFVVSIIIVIISALCIVTIPLEEPATSSHHRALQKT